MQHEDNIRDNVDHDELEESSDNARLGCKRKDRAIFNEEIDRWLCSGRIYESQVLVRFV